MSAGEVDNLSTMYGLVTIAGLGVGAVIIPCSIIAQLACPHELVGTITAITLAIRYIGGAIGFTAYYNVFYHKLETIATEQGAQLYGGENLTLSIALIQELMRAALEARYDDLRDGINNSPYVPANFKNGPGYDRVIEIAQEVFAEAYRYPCKSGSR